MTIEAPTFKKKKLTLRKSNYDYLLSKVIEESKTKIENVSPNHQISNAPIPMTTMQVATLPLPDAGASSRYFCDRKDSDKVVSSFGSKSEYSILTRNRIEIGCYSSVQQYRYMYDNPAEKLKIFDDRINVIGSLIASCNEFLSDIADPSVVSQSSFKTVGRISSLSDEKLNDKSVVLESSFTIGKGARIKLNLSQVPAFSLFPGQIVGVEGINSGSFDTSDVELKVSKFMHNPLPEMYTTPISELYTYNHSSSKMNGENMNLVVSSGPYCTDDNLEFEAFNCLLEKLENSPPDVLILMGPFIDEQHPLIQQGLVPLSPSELFQYKIVLPLYQFLKKCIYTNVILVPSLKDLFHPWNVFPQPGFDIKEWVEGSGVLRGFTDKNLILERVSCLPNPCIFAINEITIALTTTDILSSLSLSEINRSQPNSQDSSTNSNVKQDRFSRLIKHLLEQRSFFPVSPPPKNNVNEEGLNINYLKCALGAEISLMPDLFICPSKFTHFIKNVDKMIAINPGPITKPQTGGTYARLIIRPIALENFSGIVDDKKDHEEEMYHGLEDRSFIEIVRI